MNAKLRVAEPFVSPAKTFRCCSRFGLFLAILLAGCPVNQSGYLGGFPKVRELLRIDPLIPVNLDFVRQRLLEEFPVGSNVAEVLRRRPQGLTYYRTSSRTFEDGTFMASRLTLSDDFGTAEVPFGCDSILIVEFILDDNDAIMEVDVTTTGVCL